MKTNAVRVLERAGMSFELRQYLVDEEHHIAEHAAEELSMPPETVCKTLVVQGDQTGYLFALLPAGTELDLRSLAEASGNKRVALVPQRDVLGLTGYVRGAVTVLAAKRAYPIFIDETAMLWPAIGISGGTLGLEIILSPPDFVTLTGATLADIAR
jgi:Cys-tRNA(Pro)/Cys-tRNA(Cys) deacylase